MTTDQIFRTIFFAQFLAILAVRIYFGWRVRKVGQSSWSVENEAVQREGRWSVLLRPLAFLALLALVGLYAALPGEPEWLVMPLPDGLRWTGVGLGVIGLGLLIWVHRTLREFWSTVLQLRGSHRLIAEGPYRRVRHPMYAVLMFCFLNLSLISAAWPLLLLTALTVPFFYRVTVKEEEMMIGQFGDEYRAYRERTGRFLPRSSVPGGPAQGGQA
jgi:protein-S-isoprenylcysteine O-methyltransferase Ste14